MAPIYQHIKLHFRLYLLSFSVWMVSIFASAQYNINEFKAGARSAAMSHASITHRDVWANFHNQANMALAPALDLGFHAENRFYSENLASGSFAASIPVHRGVVFSNISFFGYELYNEAKGAVGYTQQLFQNLAASVQFDYFSAFQSENLGTSRAVTFELGLAGHINEQFRFGAHLINPASAQLNNIAEYNLPSVASFGISYGISDFMLNAELEKDFDNPPVYQIGGEYTLTDIVVIRAGASNGFSKYSFGLGFLMESIRADFAFADHGLLGFTPHFSLIYRFKTLNPDREPDEM